MNRHVIHPGRYTRYVDEKNYHYMLFQIQKNSKKR